MSEFTEYTAETTDTTVIRALAAADVTAVVQDLMDFAARRKLDRQAKRAAAAAASAAQGSQSNIQDVEIVWESKAVRRERQMEDVVVDEVDPTAEKRIGEIPPSNTGGEMPAAEESYAIHRVKELRSIAASTKTFQPDEETMRAAKEAQQINIEAMDDAKPKGKATGGGSGKGVPRGRAAKVAQ